MFSAVERPWLPTYATQHKTTTLIESDSQLMQDHSSVSKVNTGQMSLATAIQQTCRL